jgi:hypothetical protein
MAIDPIRHCERSAAIQRRGTWIAASASPPRNDEKMGSGNAGGAPLPYGAG